MISAQELKMLPDNLLDRIAKVLVSYTDGFPSWFMLGLTCPLAKTQDTPSHDQTRPITILAQLYRLWNMETGHHQASQACCLTVVLLIVPFECSLRLKLPKPSTKPNRA